MEKNLSVSIRKRISILLAIVIMFSLFPSFKAKADAMELGCGGLRFAWEDLIVYDAKSGGNVIGKIFENESFTVLEQNAPEGFLWVDYSTSKGAKQGYVHIDPDEWGGRPDAPARVKNTSNVYYGALSTGSNYQKAGAVYKGEYVSVIAVSGEWAYVEYNGASKRKRGYMPLYNLELSQITPDAFASIYNDYPDSNRPQHAQTFNGYSKVYAGPTTLYAEVGSVSNETVYRYGKTIYVGPYVAYYIEYYVNGTTQLKSGFIVTT